MYNVHNIVYLFPLHGVLDLEVLMAHLTPSETIFDYTLN